MCVLGFAASHIRAQQSSPLIAVLNDAEHPAWVEAWQPNGSLLAAAFGNDIHLYTSDKWQSFTTLQGHAGALYALGWNPSGTILVSGGDDNTVRLWDIQTQTTIKVLDIFKGLVLGVWWSPDGSKLAVNSSDHVIAGSDSATDYMAVSIWDVTNPANPFFVYQLPTLPGPIWLAWSADSSKLFIANKSNETSYLSTWGVSDGQLQNTMEYAIFNGINDIQRQPKRDVVALATDLELVDLWDPTSDQYTLSYDPQVGHSMQSVAWSPDGTQLASADDHGVVQIWDAATAKPRVSFHDTAGVYRVRWSADGTKLASLNTDFILKIWDVSDLPEPNNTPTTTFYPTWTPFSLTGTATPTLSPWS